MNYQVLVGVLLYLFVFACSIVILFEAIYTLSAKTMDNMTRVFIDYYATKVCVKMSENNITSETICFNEIPTKTVLASSIILLCLSVLWIIACVAGYNKIKLGLGILLFLNAIILIVAITTTTVKLNKYQELIDPASVKFENYTATSIVIIVACCLVIIHQIVDFPIVNRLIFKH